MDNRRTDYQHFLLCESLKGECGERFVANFIHYLNKYLPEGQQYTSAEYQVFTEARIPHIDYPDSLYKVIDVYLLVYPDGQCDNPIRVALEVKRETGDIFRDEKMEDYLHFCDYFFLAVDNYTRAIHGAMRINENPFIGMVTLNTSEIIVFPYQQQVLYKQLPKVINHIIYAKCRHNWRAKDKFTVILTEHPETKEIQAAFRNSKFGTLWAENESFFYFLQRLHKMYRRHLISSQSFGFIGKTVMKV